MPSAPAEPAGKRRGGQKEKEKVDRECLEGSGQGFVVEKKKRKKKRVGSANEEATRIANLRRRLSVKNLS